MRRSLEQMQHGELERLLDAEVSFYVRVSRSSSGGHCGCYTCGSVYHYTKMDAGHYISRVNRGTRWDLRNIRPQCTRCNRWAEGEKHLFREALVNELGEAEVYALEGVAKMYGKTRLPREWLIQEIKTWRKRNAKIKEAM